MAKSLTGHFVEHYNGAVLPERGSSASSDALLARHACISLDRYARAMNQTLPQTQDVGERAKAENIAFVAPS
ncbi:MAG: hypothetical protein LH632_08675, partial [Rhodoferax sp.]|nr:hypothetical protein [Rhodoferax sp.]